MSLLVARGLDQISFVIARYPRTTFWTVLRMS